MVAILAYGALPGSTITSAAPVGAWMPRSRRAGVLGHRAQPMAQWLVVPRNFRDVGEWANVAGGRALVHERLFFRAGKIEPGTTRDEIGHAATIVNPRMHPDPPVEGASMVQVATSNDLEKYDTKDRKVRAWLNRALALLANASTTLPILYHCASGKDRTGVVAAVALVAIGVPREVAITEYMLSEGGVQRELIERALDGVGDPEAYLDCVDIAAVATRLRA